MKGGDFDVMFQQVYLYIYKSLGPYKESDRKFRMTEEQQRNNAMEEMQWV